MKFCATIDDAGANKLFADHFTTALVDGGAPIHACPELVRLSLPGTQTSAPLTCE